MGSAVRDVRALPEDRSPEILECTIPKGISMHKDCVLHTLWRKALYYGQYARTVTSNEWILLNNRHASSKKNTEI